MAGRNCCNSITLRLMLFTNLDSVIDKYQTGVMSITCNSRTDGISFTERYLREQAFCQDIFPFWLRDMRIQSVMLWVCGVINVNIFLSVNKF